jgi:hypothetical protein
MLALAAFCTAALCVTSVRSEESRVLLIDPDRAFLEAVRASLSAWHTTVIVERIRGPGNTMPGSAQRARALAERRTAQAVVWISQSEEGFALWMFDASEDRVLARRLSSGPPFDEITAASIALVVKTLLRHSDVPPPAERARLPASSKPDPAHRSPSWLRAGLGAGLRGKATSESHVELRLALGLDVWPRAFEGLVGLGLEASSGPAVAVDHELFQGDWFETAFMLALHGHWKLSQELDLGAVLGSGFDISTLRGVIVAPAERVRATRLNPVAALRIEVGYAGFPALRLSLGPQLDYFLRTQTYLVRGSPVFEVHALVLGARLFAQFGLL